MKKSLDESELLFENWMPNMDELKEAVISDGKEYYPEAKPSPQFCFRTEKSESDPETLELFDVLERVKSGSNHKDLLMNVGGPVWALDWCPRSSVDEVAQYIAVSAYNSDEYHVFSKPYSGKHIIQIWSLGKLTNSGAPSKPYLALGIAHEGGFVWDLQWCPKGSVVKQKVNGKIVPRLGLLAAACGDGTLRIYSVPDPEHLHKELGKAGSPLILKLKPAYEVSLPFPSLIWRCAWNPTCDKIATGCTDGTVAVFKPSDKNSKVVTNTIPPPLKPPTVDFETCLGGAKDVKDEPDEVTLSNMNTVSFLNSRKTQLTKIPIAYFTAHRTCALVQWSSEGAPRDLLVSMGDSIKFWDLRNTSCPLQQYTFGTKIANSITFGSQLSTVMCCFDDGSVRYLDPTGMSRQFVYHGASLWGGSSSSLVEHFATCDASGVVKTMPTNDCIKHARLAASTFPRPTTVDRLLYEDSILKFAGSHKIAKNEYDALNELTGNDEESEEEEKPKKKSKAKAKNKKKKDDEDNDEEENEENNNNNTNDTPNKKPKKQLLDPMRAFHRVRWNPNFSACMWLAYAGKSGLLRCQSIDWVV
jgi:WD40 repeat protein